MKKIRQQTVLRKAVEWLKKQGTIKRDKDLEDIFKLNSSTISIYLSGNPSIDFPGEFEKYFGINLKDFEGDNPSEMRNVKNIDQIAVLNAQVLELTRALAKLNQKVTKQDPLDYYLDLRKRMSKAINESSGDEEVGF